MVATRAYEKSNDNDRVKTLEEQKDNVAIAMIARIDNLKRNFKRKNVKSKIKQAKAKGLTDSDIKKLLFADFFRPPGVPSIIAGASTAGALLSSFRESMESILDGSYVQKLRIIKFGHQEGDGDVPKGDDDDVAPGGSLDDEDDNGDDYDVAQGGSIANDVVTIGPLNCRGKYDGDIDIFEEIETRYPGAKGHAAEDIERWFFTNETGGGRKDEYETTIGSPIGNPSGGEEAEYETTIGGPPCESSGGIPIFSVEERN